MKGFKALRAELKSPFERERRGRQEKRRTERRSEALPRRVRLRQKALGPSLSTWPLRPSLGSPFFSSLSLFFRYRLLFPPSEPRVFRQLLPFRLSSSFNLLVARYVSLVKLSETKGTWHSATGMELALMARALGPSEQRNIVLTSLLFSQNSACTSSIFSPFSRAALFPERSACARHFMSHNYCSSLLILRCLYLRSNPLRSSLLLLFFSRVINDTRLNELSRRTVQT